MGNAGAHKEERQIQGWEEWLAIGIKKAFLETFVLWGREEDR